MMDIMQPLKTCTTAISVILWLACCHAVFADGVPVLSIRDFVGTYQLERAIYFNGDPVESTEGYANSETFVLGENYYQLGDWREETGFTPVTKGREKDIETGYRAQPASEFFGLFPEYSPRLFNEVFVCGGFIWIIEVLDPDTLVVQYQGAFMLFKRVKSGGA